MDKIKQFCIAHKKEIAVTTAIIFSYRLGFKHGCVSTDKAVTHFCKEASKVLNITEF